MERDRVFVIESDLSNQLAILVIPNEETIVMIAGYDKKVMIHTELHAIDLSAIEIVLELPKHHAIVDLMDQNLRIVAHSDE